MLQPGDNKSTISGVIFISYLHLIADNNYWGNINGGLRQPQGQQVKVEGK